MLRAALVIAGKDLRLRLRNRTAIIMGVLAPLGMAALIGFAFGGAAGFSVTVAVVDADGSPLAAGVVDGLTGGVPADAPLRFVAADSEDAGRNQLADGTVDAVLIVPTGFGSDVEAGRGGTLTVVVDADRRIAGDVAQSVADGIAARIDTSTLGVATALAATGEPTPEQIRGIVAAAGSIEDPVTLEVVDVAGAYSPVAYCGASMGMLFLFFTTGAAARALLLEARTGTLDRIRSAPVTDGAVLGGTALATLALGVSSLVAIWAVTSLAFGASWGSPTAVLALIVGIVVTVSGITALVAGLARTDAQVDGLTSIIAFVFALLGGAFLTPGALPEPLATLALLTPIGLALDGFLRVGAGGATLLDVAGIVLVLVATGVVAGVVGLGIVRRRVLG